MTREEQTQRFIHLLAKFLVDGQVGKSIALSQRKVWALEWAALRDATPLFGYLTVEEAEQQLREFLRL